MLPKVFQLKTDIHYSKNKSFLRKIIKNYLKKHDFISSNVFWWKRKKIYLKKWEEVNIDEKKRYKLNRLQSFFCWIELIKTAKTFFKSNKTEYELIWITANWTTIFVHLRKEKDILESNKYIFHISSYVKN